MVPTRSDELVAPVAIGWKNRPATATERDELWESDRAFTALEAYELLVERGKVELRPEQIAC
jgi:hypothetical protein